MGDILLMADPQRVFTARGRKPKTGAHGFDPLVVKDMRTVFYAWGPAFRQGKVIAPFENVDVYPIVAAILGLNYQHTIDGSKKVAEEILLKKRTNQ
jgi:predicted AlkP superfamily pyrophosphatase or phosphodiesterase